jgi:RimJ/RimL family protein N-acetyltransferase
MRYFKKVAEERVYLSPINIDDAETYVKWVNDIEVAGHLGNYVRMIGLSNEREILEKLAKDEGSFAIIRMEDDALIGGVSLNGIDHLHRRANIGIFIGDAENRGKGYGTEAIRLMLDYGFHTLNLQNIMLQVHADNPNAIACYNKVGFKEFGRRRSAHYRDGEYIDVVFMDILDEDFYG